MLRELEAHIHRAGETITHLEKWNESYNDVWKLKTGRERMI